MSVPPPVVNASAIAMSWLANLDAAVSSGNAQGTASLFLPNGWFRDLLTFTWDFRSLCGPENISAFLSESNRLAHANISDLKLDETHGILPSFSHVDGSAGVEAAFVFETPVMLGRGFARLLLDQNGDGDGEWKALTVFMMMADIKGHEEQESGSGIHEGHTKSWCKVREERQAEKEQDPHVLIVGAGQTGLNIGARFRQMNIPSLIIESNDRVGDNWRKRYPSLVLHTPKNQHSMLYQAYPRNWPKYTHRDMLASWLEQYAVHQELVIWTSTTLIPTPTYDLATRRWTVKVVRDGKMVTLRPVHIVLATGTVGAPSSPRLPNPSDFRGEAFHAIKYGGGAPYSGKKVIVIGSGNTAADICEDLVDNGVSEVTMVQRSTTVFVDGPSAFKELDSTWPELADVSVSDFKNASMPLGLVKRMRIARRQEREEQQKDIIEALRKKGFKCDEGPDGAGYFMCIYERFGGNWFNVGCAELMIDGKVGLKSGTEAVQFKPDGLVFADGSELDADVVIFATGYHNILHAVGKIFGEDTVKKTGQVWGLNEECEIRSAYRPCGVPGLWYGVGDFYLSRFYSKHLALQVKARQIGLVDDSKDS